MSRIAASSLATTSATRRIPSRGARIRPRARLARLPTSPPSATGVPKRGRRVHASAEETPMLTTPTRVTLERDAHAGAVLALATIPPDAATGRPLLVVSTSMDGTAATWTLDPSSGALAPRERLAPADGSAPWWCVVPAGDGDAVYVGTHARDARAADARRIVASSHHGGPDASRRPTRVSNHTGWVRAIAVLQRDDEDDEDVGGWGASAACNVVRAWRDVARELVGRGQRSRVHRRHPRPRDVVRPAVLRRRGRNRAGVERSRGRRSRDRIPAGARGAGGTRRDVPAATPRRRCKRRGGR